MNTRNRAVILSIILTGVYFLFNATQDVSSIIGGSFALPSILAMIMFIGIFWVLNMNVKGFRIFTIAFFAFVNVFIIQLFFEILIGNQTRFGQIQTSLLSMALVFGLNYIIILTVNILNYSYVRDIPLGQAGRASSYILSIFVEYLGFFMLFSVEIPVWLRLLLVTAIPFYIVYCILWTLKISIRENLLSTTAISLVVLTTAFILSLWPVSAGIVSLILCLILYITLGVALEMKEKMNKYIWVEYGFLISAIAILLIVTSEWGINGRLI